MSPHRLTATLATTRPIAPGDRVAMAEAFRFLDVGDAGTVQSIAGTLACVTFDGGATHQIPTGLLAREIRDFRIVGDSGRVGTVAYSTEAEAADAAEDRGLTAFEVVEVIRVASYEVSQVDAVASETEAELLH